MHLLAAGLRRAATSQGHPHARDQQLPARADLEPVDSIAHAALPVACEGPRGRENLWAELLAAGVDHINTDDLAGLEAFLTR